MKSSALLIFFATTPALAGSFKAPEGCTTYLTVQSRGCYVANYYTCEGDPAGHKWRADFDQEGPFFLSRIDGETQWIESIDLNPVVTQTLDPNPQDPASFTQLIETGRDDFIFELSKDNGEHSKVRGYDKLTGNTITIDGVTLDETEFDYSETDDAGTVLRRARGNEYISREWRMFFSGASEWEDGPDNWLPMDSHPVKFFQPGDKGFESTQPIFDCDAVLSLNSKEGLTHDQL
jgi:hypothetical protein